LASIEDSAVVFVHPSIGGIDDSRLSAWTQIPGARGCTQEACDFRDRIGELRSEGVEVIGLSGQPPAEQEEAVRRLGLPYPLLADERLELARNPGLPTFEFDGRAYYRRVTLVISRGRIEAALYPVFPPDRAAEQALAWLGAKRSSPRSSGATP
jgi:peroxiredoxin